jgi:hypothetical protein
MMFSSPHWVEFVIAFFSSATMKHCSLPKVNEGYLPVLEQAEKKWRQSLELSLSRHH